MCQKKLQLGLLHFQEANAFAAFNVDFKGLCTEDRFKFVRLLCQRFNLDVNAVWNQFIGNGKSSGNPVANIFLKLSLKHVHLSPPNLSNDCQQDCSIALNGTPRQLAWHLQLRLLLSHRAQANLSRIPQSLGTMQPGCKPGKNFGLNLQPSA